MDTNPRGIEIAAAAHPDPTVHRLGFGLNDPYVEHCWSAIVGPSATLLLRRLPHLWAQHEPARLELGDLGRSLGLGAGDAPNSRLARTLDRLTRYGLGQWQQPGHRLDVYTSVPPLTTRQLEHAPAWTRQAHTHHLDRRIDQALAGASHTAHTAPGAPSIPDRLDHLQRPRHTSTLGLTR